MARGLLMWLLGIPIPVLIILYLFHVQQGLGVVFYQCALH
jgi:uncharacterized iron-regulated protein